VLYDYIKKGGFLSNIFHFLFAFDIYKFLFWNFWNMHF